MQDKELEFVQQLQAGLKDELDSAQDYYERTGNVMQNLDPVAQRKVIEAFVEDKEVLEAQIIMGRMGTAKENK